MGKHANVPPEVSTRAVETRFFVVGVLFSVVAVVLLFVSFSAGELTPDQRMSVRVVLSLMAGIICGAFAGGVAVHSKGIGLGLVVSATGGFAVFLIVFLLWKGPDSQTQSLKELRDYNQRLHEGNVLALEEAAQRDPTKAAAVKLTKQRLDRAADSLRDDIVKQPGIPASLSRDRYNRELEKAKEIVPGVRFDEVIVVPELMDKQRAERPNA